MATEIKDRAALEATLRFMDERIKPRRCDSDGVSGCWRCQSMYLAKRMRELLAERDAAGVAEPFGGRAAWPEGAAFVDAEGRFYDEQAQPLGVSVGGGGQGKDGSGG